MAPSNVASTDNSVVEAANDTTQVSDANEAGDEPGSHRQVADYFDFQQYYTIIIIWLCLL